MVAALKNLRKVLMSNKYFLNLHCKQINDITMGTDA